MTRTAKSQPTHIPLAAPTIGLVQWFQPDEHARVEKALTEMKELGVTELRTGISWTTYLTEEGKAWYNWLIPTLAQQVQVLPCFQGTPSHLGVTSKTSAPPQNPTAFAEFLDGVLADLGSHFEWVELWNEPNNIAHYDFTLDQNWNTFSQMIAVAAQVAKQHGKKTVLGGMSPIDPNWLQLMYNRGALERIDAIGIHGFPYVFDQDWEGWDATIQRVREVLDRNNIKLEIWITEAGFSTWQHDEFKQFQEFRKVCKAPVNKVYWSSLHDLDINNNSAFHADERKYHFGLKHVDGCPKLLYRLWAENGLDGLDKFSFIRRKEDFSDQERYSVVTGGAGFVGTNLAKRLLEQGKRVLIFDNLSRTGVERNLQWLHQNYGDKLEVYVGDIRDLQAVKRVMKYANEVFHFAAQVAVTTSLTGPIQDFEINARGVVNVLEAIRAQDNPPPLVFTSTNKVYGGLEDLRFISNDTRYNPSDKHIKANGISEARPLDFHSPYGCSKGAADQYVVDYARTYGIPAVVFRMSCIYGPHQYGNEDQGWVAHFAIRAIENKAISIYGDGKQVRDILFVEDLVDAFLLAQENMKDLSGQAFNIGGGVKNTTSLLELLDLIGTYRGKKVNLSFGDWRPGDQHYYVSDIRKFHEATGWYPKNSVQEGVAKLYQWLCETRGIEVSLKAPVALEQETDNVAVA